MANGSLGALFGICLFSAMGIGLTGCQSSNGAHRDTDTGGGATPAGAHLDTLDYGEQYDADSGDTDFDELSLPD